MKNFNRQTFYKRNTILKDIGINSYQEFLKSDTWIKTKIKFNEKRKDNPFWQKCHGCGCANNLQLHHMRYKKANLKGSNLNNIIPLCNVCYTMLHEVSRKYNKSFWSSLKFMKKKNMCLAVA